MEYVRNEELLPFHKLTEEEQQTLERENYKGNVERLDVLYRQWYQNITHLYSFSIYRTISQEEQEMQHEENNEFPWHMVSSKWNALARDDTSHNWYLYDAKPCKGSGYWFADQWAEFDETAQKVIGVDMSKWKDISWEDSLMLRPGYEQQGNVERAVEDTISDEEALVVGSSSTKEYPVVKLKNLHKLNIGDVVRLKKTGELIEVGEYSEIGCSGCKFSTYDVGQHPCSKCGYLKNAYVGYNPTAETQDETFTNTELKEYADLDDKTRHLLQNKHKEGKVELYCASAATWYKKMGGDELLDKSAYRVV